MIKFTIVKGKLALDPNIALFKELKDVYDLKNGEKLLQLVYFRHSTDADNPFKDLDIRVMDENILQVVFNKSTWKELKLSENDITLFKKAEELFLFYNATPEARLLKSMNRKMDQIAVMLDDNDPVIEETTTSSGEIKFNTNLTIILNAFTKVETMIKSKTLLNNAILKAESTGKIRGGGTTSFREMGVLTGKDV